MESQLDEAAAFTFAATYYNDIKIFGEEVLSAEEVEEWNVSDDNVDNVIKDIEEKLFTSGFQEGIINFLSVLYNKCDNAATKDKIGNIIQGLLPLQTTTTYSSFPITRTPSPPNHYEVVIPGRIESPGVASTTTSIPPPTQLLRSPNTLTHRGVQLTLLEGTSEQSTQVNPRHIQPNQDSVVVDATHNAVGISQSTSQNIPPPVPTTTITAIARLDGAEKISAKCKCVIL